MADYILKGESDVSGLPKISVGKIYYNQFKQFPKDRVCYLDGETEEKLTYGQLLNRSVKLAGALKRLGLKQNDVISQITESSINYFTPYYSALYCGFLFNPINPENTKYELLHYFGQTKPKCVICSAKVLAKVLELQAELPFIELVVVTNSEAGSGYYSMEQLIDEEPGNPNFEPIDVDIEEQSALILFSSGTTGLPKAVALSHKNVRSCIIHVGPYNVGVTEDDIQLYYLPCFHVISTCVTAVAYWGTKTIILRGFQPHVFLSSIEKYKCTFVVLVPPIVNFICESPMIEKFDLSSLKKSVCGSAPATKDILNIFTNRIPSTLMYNMYGLTESTCGITLCDKNKHNLDNVGKITTNMEAKFVDLKTGQTVGPNCIGELRIKGDYVLKEYYNNPEATKESFDQENFFKTGDIGYFDDQKQIHIIDRMKDMIKYKGYQVSPVEIETVLKLHKAVQDVGVIGIPDKRAGQVPIAFVVQNAKVSEKELLDLVADHLSVYKHLYGGIKFVEKIPRNTLNKIKRNDLKEMWQKMQENGNIIRTQ